MQVTAQVTDSVLYQGSDTQTINIPTTTSFRDPQRVAQGPKPGHGKGRGSLLADFAQNLN